MKYGEIDLCYLGGKRVVGIWGGERVLPESLIECDVGTLTAAEYVALHAVRSGKGGSAAVSLFCASLDDVGRIESVRTIPIH